jgi:choline-glycine betaine transporter
MGWVFVLAAAGFVAFAAHVGFSRFGNVRLDDSASSVPGHRTRRVWRCSTRTSTGRRRPG